MKKLLVLAFALLLLGCSNDGGLTSDIISGEKTMTAEEIVAVEKHAQDIFGKNDAKAVERMVFNKMKPATVKLKGKDWELTGMNFKTLLKEKADDGWTYEENGKELTLKSRGMAFDGKKVKTKALSKTGEIKKGEVKYKGALGEGIDIKIIQDNYHFRKIIEFFHGLNILRFY